jgi:dTDP-4-amino-4,6-dideoxygalactose transaminase
MTPSSGGVPLVDLAVQHQAVADEVRAGWDRVLADTSFIMGSPVEDFEAEAAQWYGRAACVGVANGTDAVELAVRAVGVGPGDEVVVPANSFVASAVAVSRAGAVPRFADVDPVHYLLDPASAASAVTGRTAALLPVHLYGQIAPMDALSKVAADHGLTVVEDAAQSHGAAQHGQTSGAWGKAAAVSFYPGKNLGAYGDAGAVFTDDEGVAAAVRGLRNYGSEEKYRHDTVGFNSRLDTLQAVVLSAKLRHVDQWNAQRRAAASLYQSLLAGVDGVQVPAAAAGNVHVWHLFVVEVDERDRVLADLRAAGIGASIHYPVPIHLQPAYASLGYGPGDFPVAERSAARILTLPLYPGITAAQQEQVVEALAAAVARG